MANTDPRKSLTLRCFRFLGSIGLAVHEETGASGFTPGVDIRNGELFVDLAVATPSNLLHEAGHLATTPGQYRKLMQTDVQGGQREMLDSIDREEIEIDSPLFRAIMQCCDTEATAWAWAAGTHLGIPDDLIIADEDYQDEGESVRSCLAHNSYLGINGLAHAGFCCTRPHHTEITGKPAYPTLAFWIQPDDLSPRNN